MQYQNTVTFKVWGRYALFTDPLTRIGGEKYLLSGSDLRGAERHLEFGVLEADHRVGHRQSAGDETHPHTGPRAQSLSSINGGSNDLSIYTYLADVEYQVQAHFDWNENRPDLDA